MNAERVRGAVERWIELEVRSRLDKGRPGLDEVTLDRLSGWLPEHGAHGLAFHGDDRIVATFRSPESAEGLAVRIGNALEDAGFVALTVSARMLDEADWWPHWEGAYEPLRFGPLCILPSWAEVPVGVAHPIIIDPSAAFGTGLHPTTQLCLEALVSAPPTGRVLDVGTGSGILALAALRLGATTSVGLDIDPMALDTARQAAMQNGLSDRFVIPETDVADVAESFDVVIANLRAEPLVRLAPALVARTAPGGRCLVSGLFEAETPLVAKAFGQLEVGEPVVTHKEGWTALMWSF